MTSSLKLLVFPCSALALAVAMLFMQKRGIASVDQYLNAIGNAASNMFVTLLLTVLLPFHCLPNPNGTTAMASMPSLLCWQGKHNVTAAMGGVGILFYPLCIFTVAYGSLGDRQRSAGSDAVVA